MVEVYRVADNSRFHRNPQAKGRRCYRNIGKSLGKKHNFTNQKGAFTVTAMRISNSFCVTFTDTAELINCIFLFILTTLEGMSDASIIAKITVRSLYDHLPKLRGQCSLDSV
jgi:hypothetical protein